MIFWLLSLLLSRSLFLWLFSPCLAVLASLTLLVVVVVFFFLFHGPFCFSNRRALYVVALVVVVVVVVASCPYRFSVTYPPLYHPIPSIAVSLGRCFCFQNHTHTHTHTYIHIQPKYFTPFWSPTFSLHFTRSYRTKRREHRSRTTPNHNGRVPRVGPTFRFMETRSFEPNILSFGRVLEVPCVCCVYCVGAILVTFGLTVSIE